MKTVQTRIAEIEKQADAIVTKDLRYIFFTKIDDDGSMLYQVDIESGKEWISKEEFDKYIESCNYKDKSKPFIIFDIPIFGSESGIRKYNELQKTTM